MRIVLILITACFLVGLFARKPMAYAAEAFEAWSIKCDTELKEAEWLEEKERLDAQGIK